MVAAGMINSRSGFAEDLWLYGEDDLAIAMLDTDDDTFLRVMVAAGAPVALDADSRQQWSVQEMAALGAVQVLTGTPRRLQRRRRRPAESLESLWLAAGRPRPDPDDEMSEALALHFAHEVLGRLEN